MSRVHDAIAAGAAAAGGVVDCPEGYPDDVVCLTPEATHCLSAQALDQHEADLSDCLEEVEALRRQRDDCAGRVNECRVTQAQLRELNTHLTRENAVLNRWEPWKVWGAAGAALLVGGAGGYFGQKLFE